MEDGKGMKMTGRNGLKFAKIGENSRIQSCHSTRPFGGSCVHVHPRSLPVIGLTAKS